MSQTTGYPSDMLDLDLDLEADLGIDTVKQAEVFAAVREMYNIPRDENRKLRDYPTLAHVIRFVLERTSSAASEEKPQAEVAEPPSVPIAVAAPAEMDRSAASVGDSVEEKLLEIVVEKTGYPKEMLDLDLDLD